MLALVVAALLAVIVVAAGLVVGRSPNPWAGQIEPDGGANHIATGQIPTYSSIPSTSAPH